MLLLRRILPTGKGTGRPNMPLATAAPRALCHSYRINHYSVQSDIALPADPRCRSEAALARGEPLTVRFRPGELTAFEQVGYMARWYGGFARYYETGDGVLLCAGPDLRMHVARGDDQEITVDCPPEALPRAAMFVINNGIALATHFRGGLPLHAAGGAFGGRLFGILADSGTGKSTTMDALREAGARFAADDLIPVRFAQTDGSSVPVVIASPSYSLHAKIGREMLAQQGRPPAGLEPTATDPEKLWLPVSPEERALEPGPLAALFLLQPLTREDEIDPRFGGVIAERQHGMRAAIRLMQNTFVARTLSEALDPAETMRRYAALVRTVPVYALRYWKRYTVLPELAHTVRSLVTDDEAAGDEADIVAGKLANRRRDEAPRFAFAVAGRGNE